MKIVRLFAAFTLICFALSSMAQAVGSEPHEGDLIGNKAEEDDAVPDLGSDAEEAATGQAANNPNQRVIHIQPTFCQCVGTSGGEKVNLKGEFQISFAVGDFQGLRGVIPVLPVNLSKGFNGTCSTEECLVGIGPKTGRRYIAKKRLAFLVSSNQEENKPKLESGNGKGKGRFLFGVVVTARPNPPPNGEANGRVVKWTIIYKIHYEWGPDKNVKSFRVESWDVCGHP